MSKAPTQRQLERFKDDIEGMSDTALEAYRHAFDPDSYDDHGDKFEAILAAEIEWRFDQ